MPESGTVSRLELLRLRRVRTRATHGAELLRKKREALLAELFKHARPAGESHARLAKLTESAATALLEAHALHSEIALRAAAYPERDYEVEVTPRRVWGLDVFELSDRPPIQRTLAARGSSPLATGLTLPQTAAAFELLVEKALEAASREFLVRKLAAALAKTSRQVNTLDAKVIPRLQQQIRRTTRALEERERDERVRVQYLQRSRL